jgi:3-oxoadipate enol-lactonase
MIPHHTVTGPYDAPVLLLANSIGSTHAMWDAQAPALQERFRLVRYDTRGHGASEVPDGPYSLEELGGDVLELLDHLGVERASFAGLSLGGMTGMWLGVNAPGRINSLALLCTTSQHGPPEMWRDRATQVREQGTRSVAAGTMERWFTEGFRAREPDAVARCQAMVENTPDEGYAGCCAILERTNLTPELPRISAPTLVIAGAQDTSTPPDPHATKIRDGIPGARLEVLDPGAHMTTVERADDVTRLLLEHF